MPEQGTGSDGPVGPKRPGLREELSEMKDAIE